MPAERTYGIPSGYRAGQNDSPKPILPLAPAPASYGRAYNQDSSQRHDTSLVDRVSPTRRPMQLYQRNSSPSKRTDVKSEGQDYASPPRRKRSPSSSRPQHRSSPDRQRQSQSTSSPGRYHVGSATAEGGFTGLGAANYDPFDNGSQALRDIDNLFGGGRMGMSPSPEPEEQRRYQQTYDPRTGYVAPLAPAGTYSAMPYPQATPPRVPTHGASDSQSSIAPLDPRRLQRESRTPSRPRQESPPMPMAYNSYQNDGFDEDVNHDDFDEDGDDIMQQHVPRRKRDRKGPVPVTAAVGSGAASMFQSLGQRDTSGSYRSVPGSSGGDAEKSEWLQVNSNGNKRMKWIVGSIIAVVLLAALIGGIAGGVLASKKSSTNTGASSASSSSKDRLYDINSAAVKKLLNNSALHKVFPGMDYTPLNAQYPDCLTNPPDQNNITLDIAMLAQLTPAVRLYGTDCNQTEMVLESINRLGYNDTVKVWLGVWLGNNATTNSRQLKQMYDILDNYPATHFAGIIVGNEVLFRKDLSEAELGDQLKWVRNNLTAKEITLPVATSDLGDDWTAALAADTDIVMANVHPFFAGVPPDEAAAWTWNFWQTNDVALTGTSKSTAGYPKNIIAETGWPSAGGNDCGTDSGTCPNSTAGAVASVDNMNTFMEDWVCQSLTNGTTYFWFEAFDEPWKVIYNTDTDKWESKWGLMDASRNVKPGLKIPDCGGQTVNKPY